jgi:UTP--glucose-1-phosphate uridylyltransferase
MAPLTGGRPKEMLPVAGRPLIHHVVQEAIDAGIEQICIVIREGKEAIPRYFEGDDFSPAEEANQTAEELRSSCEITFAYQMQPRGLGDALLCARQFVATDKFAMMIPDQLFAGKKAPVAQLTNKGLPANSVVSSLIRIPASAVSYFPGARRFILKSDFAQEGVVVITGIEQDDSVPQRTCVRGFERTIYPPEIFHFLGIEFANPLIGEVDLLRSFQALLQEIPGYGVFLEGEGFDLGTVDGYRFFEPSLGEVHKRFRRWWLMTCCEMT